MTERRLQVNTRRDGQKKRGLGGSGGLRGADMLALFEDRTCLMSCVCLVSSTCSMGSHLLRAKLRILGDFNLAPLSAISSCVPNYNGE